MTAQTNDNKFACSRFIVDEDGIGMGATHTTIASAIASASSGDSIFVKPGTYTENFTMKSGVPVIAWNKNSGGTRIDGTITINAAGSYFLEGFDLRTNGSACISISDGTLYLQSCICFAVDANFIAASGSGVIQARNCTGSVLDTGITMWTSSSSGTINFFDSNFDNSGSSTTASSNSAGTVALINTSIGHPVSTSGTGAFNMVQGSRVVCSALNVTSAALDGSGQCFFANGSSVASGTATAITVGASASLLAQNISIGSSNANAISGAGTITASGINFTNTGFLNSVTTQNRRSAHYGRISFDGGTTIVDNNIRYQGPYFENLGINYNGGTGVFTVQGATASLSTTNRAYVVLPSSSVPGEFVRYEITADQNFIDDVGASEIIGNLFGLTTGVAYASDIPFYLYAVGNDSENTIAFMISRVPHRTVAPATANIGAPDDAVANTQGSFFSLENIDETLYDGNPCLCVGSFRMQMSASDDWTVTTLDNMEGIGVFNEKRVFVLPTGVFGASTNTHLLPNGGTAPVFTNRFISYFVTLDGVCNFAVSMAGDGGTDGVGAVSCQMSIPYVMQNVVSGNTYIGYGRVIDPTNGTQISLLQGVVSQNYAFFAGGAALSPLQNGDFTNGGRNIDFAGQYFINNS